MNIALILVLLSGAPEAGLIDRLSPSEIHLAFCRQDVEDGGTDLQVVLDAWKRCLESAESKGYTDLVPQVRSELALATADLELSRLTDLPADERMERLLAFLALQDDLQFPLDRIAPLFRDFQATPRGKTKLAPYRMVTVRWTNRSAIEAGELSRVDEIVRRFMEDAGFKWAAYGTSDASEAQIVITGNFQRFKSTKPPSLKDRTVMETVIAVDELRFREATMPGTGLKQEGFLASATAEAADPVQASDDSARLAAQNIVSSVLLRVIRSAFGEAAMAPSDEPAP